MQAKWQIFLALGVAIIAFLIYLPTIAPTITWRNGGADSGDLAAAVATLGIPHPPGYPTYVLLGRAWTALPLGGDVAYRLNLLSAVCAALAAGFSAAAAGWLGRRLALAGLPLALGAGLAGLWLGLAPLTWSQATIAEVYAPGLALLALMSLCLWWGRSGEQQRALIPLAGLVGGLGLGVLPQLALAMPGGLGLLYAWPGRHGSRTAGLRRGLIPFVLAGGLGLATFAYLPLRASVQPWLNWGDPSTPARFWAVVTAAPYHQFIGLLGPVEWLLRLGESMVQLGGQIGWAGVGLALPGGYLLWRTDKAALGYLLSLTGLTLLFRAGYPVVSNIVYLIPALYGPALLAGLGVAWLLTLAQKRYGSGGVALAGLALLAVFSWRVAGIIPLVDASADWEAARFGQRVMAALPPDALIISEQDTTTFSLWYRQALGERPDVIVVDGRLLFYDWYQDHLARHYPDLDIATIEPGKLTSLDRPVYTLAESSGEVVLQVH